MFACRDCKRRETRNRPDISPSYTIDVQKNDRYSYYFLLRILFPPALAQLYIYVYPGILFTVFFLNRGIEFLASEHWVTHPLVKTHLMRIIYDLQEYVPALQILTY